MNDDPEGTVVSLQIAEVNKAFDQAAPVAPEAPAPPWPGREQAAADTDGSGGAPGQDRGEVPAPTGIGLPEGCPVTPLGMDGKICFYLNARNQLADLTPTEHGQAGLAQLFAPRLDFLYEHWPRRNQHGEVVGWKAEKVREQLMAACGRLPVWNAFERIRGAGSWVGEDGELILHCGDRIWRGLPPTEAIDQPLAAQGAWLKPGQIGRYVYPTASPGPKPASTIPPGGPEGPGGQLLDILKTWQWQRGEIDAILLLGWIGAAMLGGALDWRPMAWITGDASTGKSTLQKLLKLVFDEAIVSVSDATAAGVWQKIGHANLPIALDELEAEEDNSRNQQVIKLARQAASGGMVLRGGASHQGSEFVARSCFLFSSILVPPMLGQDRSRMAVLELGQMPPGSRAPHLDPRTLREIGAGLRARLAAAWPRLLGVLEAYRAALANEGHGSRGGDQFGTLLACADCLANDFEDIGTIDGAQVMAWASKLNARAMAAETGEAKDSQRCLDHLLTSSIDPYRGGGRDPISEWISKAAGRRGQTDTTEANKVLGTYGLKVLSRAGVQCLAVANHHQGLAGVFEKTHWAGRSGADGVWGQSLRRVYGARNGNVRFAGHSMRCVLLPLKEALPAETGDDEDFALS